MDQFQTFTHLNQRVDLLQRRFCRYFQAPRYWRIALYKNNFDLKPIHVLHYHVGSLVGGNDQAQPRASREAGWPSAEAPS